jgi:phosphoserine phosphatase RsbU/P
MAEKIMVVDDETDLEFVIRQKFRKQIRNNEFEFVFAYNGLEALAKLIENPDISIILSDINMPEMDGLTLLSRLNELKRPNLKTVICSAYGDMENIRMAMNRGAFDFVTKPVDFTDLEITIMKTIEQLDIIRKALDDHDQLISLQRDLDIAGEIQQAILPKQFPPFPDISQFDIYGSMTAAKMVGGDFFDFFLIDNDRIGFVIGDVSGKGVPAAIFMAVSRTLIRATGLKGIPSNECLNYANKLLCGESLDSMFVTVFYGILNYKTGELDYTNAGHNTPYLIKKNGELITFPYTNNTILGAFDFYDFHSESIKLEKGDTLLLYTDGITEAFNLAEEEFGEQRLKDSFAKYVELEVNEMVDMIVGNVHEFSTDVPQSDDITALAVKLK